MMLDHARLKKLTKEELIQRCETQYEIIQDLKEGRVSHIEIEEETGTIIAMIDQAKYSHADNRFQAMLNELEDRVSDMVAMRHDYPIWPHGDGPLNDWDEMYHSPIRQVYYDQTIYLIQVLRKMRKIG